MVEGWDALPGDSEAEVDYEEGQSAPIRLLSALRQYNPETTMSGMVSNLPSEVSVELTVTTPDGRRFSFAEAYERDDEPTNKEISDMIAEVYGSALTRFGAPPA